jgi:uncharacterized membrane protein
MQSVVDTLKALQPHPFIDHFTVALILFGIVVDLVASLVPSRLWLRHTALTLMIVGAVAAWGSNLTGGWEAGRVWEHVTGPAKDVLKTHARWGDVLPWVISALALWRLGVQFLGFVAASRPLYLLVAVIVGVGFVYQGHEGAELVYTYGVGTNTMPIAGVPAPQMMPGASAATEPKPIPTVYVPSPVPTAAVSPPSATSGEVGPSTAVTPPAVANSPVPGGMPAEPATPPVPASPRIAPTSAPSPSATFSGTPLNPPPGESMPAPSASGSATSTSGITM